MAGRAPHSPGGCRDVIGLLTGYMEGGLAPSIVRALEEHLKGCVACEDYLLTLRRTRAAVGLLHCDAMPAEVHRRLRDFLDTRLRPERI